MVNETWKSAIIQGAMVLLGVLLALFVDEWREDQEFQRSVVIAEELVLLEINANHERLTANRDDFIDRRERIAEWRATLNMDEAILTQLENFPGIPSTFINRSAWTMANNSRLTEYIDHEFYDAAFQLYDYGESLNDRLQVALELLVNVEAFDAEQTEAIVVILELYFDDIIDNLNSLIRGHESVIDEFGVR